MRGRCSSGMPTGAAFQFTPFLYHGRLLAQQPAEHPAQVFYYVAACHDTSYAASAAAVLQFAAVGMQHAPFVM